MPRSSSSLRSARRRSRSGCGISTRRGSTCRSWSRPPPGPAMPPARSRRSLRPRSRSASRRERRERSEAMRFGVIMPIQLKDTSLDEHFEELREEVAVAEEAGFDAVFLPEFHQARGGALVSPLLVGAALLQGTSRIRFGSAVLATPLHHPVRLAEDAIMLDWITRGRLILGLGIAHQVPDFKAFGVPRDDRIEVFEEVLDVIELCFAGEPYSYQGEHFTSEGHITPRPYTLPRP